MDKRRKRKIILFESLKLLVLASSILGVAVTISCSKHGNDNNQSKPSKPSNPWYQQDPIVDKGFVQNDDVFSIGTNESKVLEEKPREKQNKTYIGEMDKKYKNWKYPSQKYNYKVNNQNMIDGVDAKAILLNERVVDQNGNKVLIDGHDVKFNDPKWIKQEIKNGTFKKHPAADDMYLNNFDNAKVLKKHYTISSATKGDLALGLYAPAGEVVTISFDDNTWKYLKNKRNSLEIVINQNLWDNKDASNSGAISNRYPYVESHFQIDENEQTIQFGSCFGGGISIQINDTLSSSNSIPLMSQALDINFTIDGAIPCLFYQDGTTSEENWFKQIDMVKKGQLAPILQATSAYFSLSIPFSGLNEIGHKSIDKLRYPKDSFKKWNDFLYLSNYFAGRDLSNNIQRLNMEYCDDIWDDAAAWGGGMSFYCPTEWGINAIFCDDPMEVFNALNSWGVFHEINHNFEQNDAFFKRQSHGQTNVVNGFNLSVILDSSKNRSELNWSGDPVEANNAYVWSWLTTPFSIISQFPWRIANGATNDLEYPLYMLILYLVGSKNFADYVRDDARNHSNKSSNWTSMKEIEHICDTFKLNFWPFFEYFGQYWNDNWPTSYASATGEDKQIIDRLFAKYKSFEMVTCQYASGQFLYDQDKNKWIYPQDTLCPYQIPAGSQYIFKLDQMVKGLNPNFVWDEVRFNSTTKLKGKLEKHPNNPKWLVYTPSNDVNSIDEFDISIIPGIWNNKPKNYIDQYKFKIKVRQVSNQPILETTDVLNSNDFEQMKNSASQYQIPLSTFKNINLYLQDDKCRGLKVKFNFVAKEDGQYAFLNRWDDLVQMYVDDKKVFEQKSWDGGDFVQTYKVNMKKGQSIKFDYYVINTGGIGNFDLKVKLNDKEINAFDNMTIQSAPSNVVNDSKYNYVPRQIDREIFNKSLTASVNLSNYELNIIDPSSYHFTSVDTGDLGNNGGLDKWLDWNSFVTWEDLGKQNFQLVASFKTIQKIRTLFFGNGQWTSRRPTDITIYGYDENNKKQLLYQGAYPTRLNSNSYIILDKTYLLKKLEMNFEINDPDGYTNGFDVAWVAFSPDSYNKLGPSFGFNNPIIKLNGKWVFHQNDQLNTSALNNLYVLSQNQNDAIEINLRNTKGFALIGQDNNQSEFEIQIIANNKVIETKNIKLNSSSIVTNASLYSKQFDNETNITIKIINKSDKPLYLNYLMTFGSNVFLE